MANSTGRSLGTGIPGCETAEGVTAEKARDSGMGASQARLVCGVASAASIAATVACGIGAGGGVTEAVISFEGFDVTLAVRLSGPEADEQPAKARQATRIAGTAVERMSTRTQNKNQGASAISEKHQSGIANGKLSKKTESELSVR
ncbi:hypothetical protein GCM10010520_01990 [Rhizobium viscosum]